MDRIHFAREGAFYATLRKRVDAALAEAGTPKDGAARIAPFSLLVPVFGMGASALLLGEAFDSVRIAAAVLVLCGLALAIFVPTKRPDIANETRPQ